MKVLVITLFFSLSTSLWAGIKETLLNKGATCIEDEATICVLKDDQYPGSVSYIFNNNEEIKHTLFHLHGYAFGPLKTGEDFDSTPLDMIKSFQFNTAVKYQDHLLMVIPYTTGKCKDYDSYLAIGDQFEDFIEKVKQTYAPESKVHLSAHSGGGRTIAKTINRMSTIISSVNLFDAIYSSTRSPQYQSWFKIPNKKLNLIAVAPKEATNNYSQLKGATPFNESKKIFDSINLGIKMTKEQTFHVINKADIDKEINFIFKGQEQNYDHWYIQRDAFKLVLKKILN